MREICIASGFTCGGKSCVLIVTCVLPGFCLGPYGDCHRAVTDRRDRPRRPSECSPKVGVYKRHGENSIRFIAIGKKSYAAGQRGVEVVGRTDPTTVCQGLVILKPASPLRPHEGRKSCWHRIRVRLSRKAWRHLELVGAEAQSVREERSQSK